MGSALLGSWSWKGHLDCGYFFGPEGKGAYRFCGGERAFEYSDHGDAVSVYYPGELAPSRFRYQIERDALSIEDSFGETVIYTRCAAPERLPHPETEEERV